MASDFVRTTTQTRSEVTATRILEVATAAFVDGRFDATPVSELARRAGVSVGGLYGRFRTKADLLRAVAESMMERLGDEFDRRLDPDELRDADARDVLRRYAEGLVHGIGGANTAITRRLALLLRSDRDLPASRRIQEFNLGLQDRLRAALLARRAQIGHPDPDAAVAFADMVMSAAAREALLHGGLGDEPPPPDELIETLTELGCAYLRIEC